MPRVLTLSLSIPTVWSIIYKVLCILLGQALTRRFRLPSWVTPAIAFNNTTSLPLLLVQSFEVTGVLKTLDPSPDAIERIKSYFLVNSMITNSLTFALGPNLLKARLNDDPIRHELDDPNSEDPEETPLLPSRVERVEQPGNQHPSYAHQTLSFISQFNNPAVNGTLIGAVIGLIPALHKLFFDPVDKGGYFNAWLTTSMRNLGNLFSALQIIVIGVKLGQSMVNVKKGGETGVIRWRIFLFVSLIRYILWPLVSIPIIWLLATKTGLLGPDPILWFALMLMPTGPSALKIMTLADVETDDAKEKMSVAKFLTVGFLSSLSLGFTLGVAVLCYIAPHLLHRRREFEGIGMGQGTLITLYYYGTYVTCGEVSLTPSLLGWCKEGITGHQKLLWPRVIGARA